jgi:hypothetical protein
VLSAVRGLPDRLFRVVATKSRYSDWGIAKPR